METYAAEIVNNVVNYVIVGDASWATERLGGFWVDTDTLVGIGWTWDSVNGFAPHTAEEPVSE
jgi:hypothetical protein